MFKPNQSIKFWQSSFRFFCTGAPRKETTSKRIMNLIKDYDSVLRPVVYSGVAVLAIFVIGMKVQ